MSRAAVDADFNAHSRIISLKLEIYFNGIGETPLTVTKDNYLIDSDWLEESSADSSTLFGSISSNELTFRLNNENGIFSPTKVSGPYYGLIKKGVVIIPYIRPESSTEDIDWEQLGKYYVTGWTATVTGIYADVTANDEWQKVFKSAAPNYPVTKNVTFKAAFENLINLMGFNVTVSDALDTELLYSYIEGNPLSFLEDLATGALAFLTCSRTGSLEVDAFIKNRTVRATLTDDDQIMSVDAKQSISRAYNGVELTYSIPQITEQTKLIDAQDIAVSPGHTQLSNLALSSGPLAILTSVCIQGTLYNVTLRSFEATPWLVTLYLTNPAAESVYINVIVYGTTVTFTDVILADSNDTLLKVSSKYIQTAAYAEYYKDILNAFVNNTIPTLTLTTRGNPLLRVGDRLLIQSTQYSLEFDGVIQRLKYAYQGSLSCDMTLINSAILQEVS